MARFIVSFVVDTDELNTETFSEYLDKNKERDPEDDPTDDQLHDALRAWLEDDVREVLQDEPCTITLEKEST